MKIEGTIKQLESILDHTRSMAAEADADEIWKEDIAALEFAIAALRSMPEAGEPPAYIDRSKWTAKNMTDQHPVDQFICSECGAIFEDFSLCKIDEDSGDKEYCEYELKFCPACGRTISEEAWEKLERRLRE